MFYGQCSELCGMNHAFMPIAVRVVSEQVFNEWSGAMKAKDKKKAKEILEKVALEQAGVQGGCSGGSWRDPISRSETSWPARPWR